MLSEVIIKIFYPAKVLLNNRFSQFTPAGRYQHLQWHWEYPVIPALFTLVGCART